MFDRYKAQFRMSPSPWINTIIQDQMFGPNMDMHFGLLLEEKKMCEKNNNII